MGIGNEAARRVTTSPTNAFGFQTGDTGATAAAQKERVAREERSAELVREINRNQERITRARDEASRRELKHQQEILKLAKARADLEAQALEDQARLQKQLIAFQLERARAVEAGNQARLAAQRAIADASLKSFKSGGTSPVLGDRSEVNDIFNYKLKQDYAEIETQVQNINNTLLQAGETTEAATRLTSTYRETLRQAAEEANRLERARYETVEENFKRRAGLIRTEALILEEKDEKIARSLERRLVLEKAIREVQQAGLNQDEGAGAEYIDAVLAKFDAANEKLDFFEQNIIDLTNKVGGALKQAMETALVDTIAAAITGADDLNDKLKQTAATLLSTVGKAFVNAGIAGLAGNDGTGFFSILNGSFGRAEGGPVAANRPYMVGEREPELFVPKTSGTIYNQDQMRSAMATYSEENSVPVQTEPLSISLETTMINNEEYVTTEQFRKGMDESARQGAKLGEQRALNRLRQSRSTRNKLGM